MSLLNQEDQWILDHVEEEVIQAESDMEVMKYALEDIYSERLDKDIEYYSEAPIMLMHCQVAVMQEMYSMELKFIDSEEYEKCQVIKEVRDSLIKKYNITLKPGQLIKV